MTRTVLFVIASAAVAGCSTRPPESAQPEECMEVARLDQQARFIREGAVSGRAHSDALLSQRNRATDPTERHELEMEYRHADRLADEAAARRNARASELRSEATQVAAELRAHGIECDRHR